MNVKSWANGSGIEKKDNIFTQTYLYSSYDYKWNSADKIETKIKQCEHNATFVFSFLWNANFLLLLLCTVFTYLQKNIGTEMVSKWRETKEHFLHIQSH